MDGKTGISADWTGISAHLFPPFFQSPSENYCPSYSQLCLEHWTALLRYEKTLNEPEIFLCFFKLCIWPQVTKLQGGHHFQQGPRFTHLGQDGSWFNGWRGGLFHCIAYRLLLVMVAPTLGHWSASAFGYNHCIFQRSQTWGVVLYNFLISTCCASLKVLLPAFQFHPNSCAFSPPLTADGGWKNAKTSFEKSTCKSLADFGRWLFSLMKYDKPSYNKFHWR